MKRICRFDNLTYGREGMLQMPKCAKRKHFALPHIQTKILCVFCNRRRIYDETE